MVTSGSAGFTTICAIPSLSGSYLYWIPTIYCRDIYILQCWYWCAWYRRNRIWPQLRLCPGVPSCTVASAPGARFGTLFLLPLVSPGTTARYFRQDPFITYTFPGVVPSITISPLPFEPVLQVSEPIFVPHVLGSLPKFAVYVAPVCQKVTHLLLRLNRSSIA